MAEIKDFYEKVDAIKSELEKYFENVSYIQSESNICKRHIYNCDDRIIMVDNYERVYEIISPNKKILLTLKIHV